MQNVSSFIYDKSGGYKFRYKDSDKHLRYLRLQVENSLDLGWNKENIILITNFPFEHLGIKSHIYDEKVNRWSAFSNKMPCFNWAIKQGIVNDDVWYKDIDCYQLAPFEFPDVGNGCGFTRHAVGRNKPQGGSSFWSKDAYDIIDTIANGIRLFKTMKEESFFPCFFEPKFHDLKLEQYDKKGESYRKKYEECKEEHKDKIHKKLNLLCKQYTFIDEYFSAYCDRFKWLNFTYGLFRVHDFRKKWPRTDKPVLAAHFKADVKACADCFVYGKNRYNVKVVDDRLKKLMLKYDLLSH